VTGGISEQQRAIVFALVARRASVDPLDDFVLDDLLGWGVTSAWNLLAGQYPVSPLPSEQVERVARRACRRTGLVLCSVPQVRWNGWRYVDGFPIFRLMTGAAARRGRYKVLIR
jgi:hypothetical protein